MGFAPLLRTVSYYLLLRVEGLFWCGLWVWFVLCFVCVVFVRFGSVHGAGAMVFSYLMKPSSLSVSNPFE